MKPMIILPPDTMSPEDIEVLRKNDICVVVSKDPSKVKFVDPIPAMGQRTQIEQAAINLSRIVLTGGWGHYTSDNSIGKNLMSKIFVDLLSEGTPLDPRGTQEEKEKKAFDYGRINEMERLGREEAKAERAAAKAAKAKKVEAK